MSEEQLPRSTRKVNIGNEEIVLDSKKLEFNEATISKFQDELAVYFDYYCQKLADMEYIRDRISDELDEIYAKLYIQYKEEGGTEKMVDSKVKCDPVHKDKAKELAQAKYRVRQLQQHIRAWDRAHDNATSRGHTLRKEMDKLNFEFRSKEAEANDIVKGG